MTPEREALARRWTEGEVIDLYPSDVGALLGEALAEIDRLRAEIKAERAQWDERYAALVLAADGWRAERERIIQAGNGLRSAAGRYRSMLRSGEMICDCASCKGAEESVAAWDALEGGGK